MIKYTIHYYLNTISPKGRIAWEYNPLHNFRRTKNTDKNGLHYNQIKLYGQLYTLASVKNKKGKNNQWYQDWRYKDINGKTLLLKYIINNEDALKISGNSIKNPTLVYLDGEIVPNPLDKIIFYNTNDNIEAGSIVDLDTELLNFSLNNPVQIETQPSYDGSVNLILNDNRNPPRLINTRFSTRELNTYEIVDRIGDNDTNIYDDDVNQFNLDTSLYKKYNKIPKIKFNKILYSGNLKVGNYVLYFRYCDADENETDFVAESGIIAIFKGNDKDPFSIDGGFVDMNAHKSIDITLTNIDEAYDYIKVYYSRASSDLDQNRQITAHKLVKKFVVSRNQCHIVLTGDEEEELIPVTELTSEYFIADKVKTQAQCQNMLFLGNVTRPDPLHQDLTDLSIRMLPYYKKYDSTELVGYVEPETYIDLQNVYNNYEYYNTKNIYYNVGYWNEEMYRIGVVYIMYDNTLSKVYNIRGCEALPAEDAINSTYTLTSDIFDDEGNRLYIEVSEDDYSIIGGNRLENSRGVVRFADFSVKQGTAKDNIYQLGIVIPEDVISYLKDYCKIKGLFFVRQKRIPTILAQGLTLPIDPEARVPLLYASRESDGEEFFFTESFISQGKVLDHQFEEKVLIHDYDKRLIYAKDLAKRRAENSNCAAILCPEFEIRQQYFNQFFTGTEYPISYCNLQYGNIEPIQGKERFYTHSGYKTYYNESSGITTAKLISVSEEVPAVAIGEEVFKGVAGTAQEIFKYSFAFREGSKTKDDTNLVRGIYHPYIGAVFANKVNYGKLVNIYIPGYNISELANYYKVRYVDNSPYYPIGDRIGIDDISTYEFDSNTGYKLGFFRGDCYLCTFTHRINRNFQDPSAPANDIIVDRKSWIAFDPEDRKTFTKVNLGDVNAVKLGSWYTFKIKSNTNLSIRSLDESHIEEKGVFGLPRGFYPLQQELLSGNNKIPDSYNVNDGFRGNFGEKFYLRYPDVPYIKNNYENRILYSQIAVNDAFRNGYRVFKSTHFNDYTKEHGSIIKLVTMSSQGLQNGLLCVFEHAIGYIPVRERAVAGEGAGGNVYINTSNVLPDNPRIISDKFGSQWQESIILTPYGVYGVDTVAKKIWRTTGNNVEILSDIKVNKFLVDNITLSEKELTPIIGIRNVKTHYNANKSDVMFTFYDNQYGIEEKVWNLCYNELTNTFITFYSWVPSYSENIDNTFFSFDRETSKAVAKLGTSQVGSTNADGIVLNPVVIDYKDNLKQIIRLNQTTQEERLIEYIKKDAYSEQLIPFYMARKIPTLNFNSSDDYYGWVINHTAEGEEVYEKNNGYIKPAGIDAENKYYKLIGSEGFLRADAWDEIIAHYINSSYKCDPWNILNTGQFEDIYTTRIETEIIGLENRITPILKEGMSVKYEYEILKDPYGNWKNFILVDQYQIIEGEVPVKRQMLKFWPVPEKFESVNYPEELCLIEGLPYLLYRVNSNPYYIYLKDSNGNLINIEAEDQDDIIGFGDQPIQLQNSSGKFGNMFTNPVVTDGTIYTYGSKRPQPQFYPEDGFELLDNYKSFYTESNINNIKSKINAKLNKDFIEQYRTSALNTSLQYIYENLTTEKDLETKNNVGTLIGYLSSSNWTIGQVTNVILNILGYIKNDSRFSQIPDLEFLYVISYLNSINRLNTNDDQITRWMNRLENWYINKADHFITYNRNKINLFNSKKVWYVYLRCNISIKNSGVEDWDAYTKRGDDGDLRYNYGHYDSIIAITSQKVLENSVKYDRDSYGHYTQIKDNIYCEVLTTDFWKHGQSGIIDIKDEIEPCLWYGKQHPFEFEFVVRDVPNMHKIFDNLEIISNKAEPESFHFEVVGETYEFANDKLNMYFRQEATKEFWQNYGINTTFDRNYTEIKTERNFKSTIFPLYYNRIDTYDNIYDYYTQMRNNNRDYRNLSGSEIIRDKQLSEYRIRTHMKNTPITKDWNKVTYAEYMRFPSQYRKLENGEYFVWKDTGRLRGNSHYKEDRWKIQIPSISFMQKNERSYVNSNYQHPSWTEETKDTPAKPPIVINYIPDDYPCTFINKDYLPNIYAMSQVKPQISNGTYKLEDSWPDTNKSKWDIDKKEFNGNFIDVIPWTYRKETKIRDKYMKVRIRYEGSELAVIQAVLTTYTESYA